ncbi:unnamed protein product [Schistosoma curassoni]|uniref:DUF6451 domain-containing protein n=1 Tax=Schistosoma curassoni TaxID=6186 RepID=A0A183KHA2_9TREM|nr:unnamed protein product [Schistosoma curassoni]
MKRLYDTMKKLARKYSKPKRPVKDKEGKSTTEIQEQQIRWVERFEEFLNMSVPLNTLDIEAAYTGRSDFTDDLIFLCHTDQQMQVKATSMTAASEAVRLNIHKGKYNTENTNAITLYRGTLEELEIFKYLGSIIDERGGSDANVKARSGKAKTTFLQLNNIWNSKQLSTNIKVIIFNTNIKTVPLYRAETWCTTTIIKV